MIKHSFFLVSNSQLATVAHAGTVVSPAKLSSE